MNLEDMIRETLDEVFEIKSNLDFKDYFPDNILKWDSPNHMKMCLALEKKFNIIFDNDEIETLVNINIIANTIRAHL